ncbi:MAG: hypothetical protein CVU52_04385 [Deltaproteobacteria bacterium HGW-Deltaproteobacteria-10]|nr:MAG: hypothetical protein CVU52_04385 [Deltaproteobacteria bacterium HGW-Deltaproteobacteria-10]
MNLNIPPGEPIFLRFDVNDIRKSQLHEIQSNNLITLEQPQPPVEKTSLQRIVAVTYKDPNNDHRLGFEARIQEITDDYRIILLQLNDPAPCNLRAWPRIRLDLLPDVRAFCHDKEIQVIDVSGGGTHIILQKDDCGTPAVGQIVNLKFVFEKGEAVMEGEILRKWQDPCKRDHVAIQFRGDHDLTKFIY